MIVYRIGRTKHANDLTGEGARLYGARWNHVGTPCVYTSENRALALLEYTVNIGIDDIPRALSIMTISIPDHQIHTIPVPELPGNWKTVPPPPETKDFGTALLKSAVHPILKMPSSVITEEFNFLLNPLHPDSSQFEILLVQDFIYDVRIKLA